MGTAAAFYAKWALAIVAIPAVPMALAAVFSTRRGYDRASFVIGCLMVAAMIISMFLLLDASANANNGFATVAGMTIALTLLAALVAAIPTYFIFRKLNEYVIHRRPPNGNPR